MCQSGLPSGVSRTPGMFKGQESVDSNTKRKHVKFLVGFSSANDFGCHVLRCACSVARHLVGAFVGDGESKVDELEPREIFIANKVSGTDVAVDEPLVMNGLDRISHLAD